MTSPLDRAHELLANVPGSMIDKKVAALIAERDGLATAARDLLRAIDDGDVAAAAGIDGFVLRVSFRSLAERLRAALPDADAGGGK